MIAARFDTGLVIVLYRKRERETRKERTVSLLRTHTEKEQNRTLLTFEQ
jgi:hypothetical protein